MNRGEHDKVRILDCAQRFRAFRIGARGQVHATHAAGTVGEQGGLDLVERPCIEFASDEKAYLCAL
jgi:hypothetical protein